MEASTVKIIEKRIVSQEWHETETTKTGWDSFGWVFDDDRQSIPNGWTVTTIINCDKYGNPFLGVAEKETCLQ